MSEDRSPLQEIEQAVQARARELALSTDANVKLVLTGAYDALAFDVDPNAGAAHQWYQWFDPGAFADIPPDVYQPGNAKRATITGPGLNKWDLAVFKNLTVTERLSLQFRCETFNIFNHTSFSAVDTTVGSPQYGQVVGAHDPRIIQLALKVQF